MATTIEVVVRLTREHGDWDVNRLAQRVQQARADHAAAVRQRKVERH